MVMPLRKGTLILLEYLFAFDVVDVPRSGHL
jgi:hypothetical protein